jgi:conjugal transfer mating pair stabilization protein TraG
MASLSRSNGYQISDDMSQVIASRYAEMAASPEFRDLGAPSLTNTTPSPHQREVRNMIVGRSLSNMRPRVWRRFRQAWWIRLRRWGVCGGRLSFPCQRRRLGQRRGGADQRPVTRLKDQAMHRERAVMRRAMMRLGRQFSGGD